jgi:hypothetical protein
MVESGLAYSSGRGAETLFGLTTDADRQRLSATEALRVQRDLCRYLVASGSANTREELQQQLRLGVEAIDVLVNGLVAEGYLAQQGSQLRARHFELGVGTEQGWETAVLDHFRAVTTAIAAKVNRPVAQADDEVGGSTRSFLVHPDHPCRQEVMDILRQTRQRTSEIWTRVAAHNEAFPPPEDADRVTFYFGQNVVRGAVEDSVTGASESATTEEVSQ